MSVIKFYPSLFFPLLSIFYKDLQISILTADANDVIITIPALGRTTKLGALYSGATDKFSSESIFGAELSPNLVRTTGIPFTKTNYKMIRTQSDKNVLLGVCGSINAGVNLGFFGASGSASAEYLKDIKENKKSVEAAMNMETASVKTNVDILSNELLALVDKDALAMPGNSHAVVGISWGAQIVIKLEFLSRTKVTKGKWKTSWEFKVNFLFFSTGRKGERSGEFPIINETETSFKFEIFGESANKTTKNKGKPTTVEEVFELIKKFPKTIYADNGGKGQEMFFHLMPLNRIRRVLELKNPGGRFALSNFEEPPLSRSYLTIPEADTVVVQLEEAALVLSKLRSLSKKIHSSRFMFNQTDLERVENLYREFDALVKEQKKKLKRAIIDLRMESFKTGTDVKRLSSISSYYDLLTNFKRTIADVEDEVDRGFVDEKLKMALASFLIQKGVGWVGRDEEVENIILQKVEERNDDETQFCQIHFYREYLYGSFGFLETVLNLVQSKGNKYLIIIIDCDFVHKSCQEPFSHEKICEPIFLKNIIDSETRKMKKRDLHEHDDKPCTK